MDRDIEAATNLPAAFFAAIDADGKTLSISEAMRVALGFELGEGVGRPFASTLLAEEDRESFAKHFEKLLREGKPFVRELAIVGHGGRRHELEWHASLVLDAKGEFQYVAGVGVGLGPRRRLEALLAGAQRMETLGFMAGGVGHDLNNLLMSIQSSVSMAVLDLEEAVHRQIEAASQLTQQLLGGDVPATFEPQSLDLNTLVEETVETFRRGREVRFESDLAPGLPPVATERVHLERVLIHLFVHGADALTQGGRLRVVTRKATPQEIAPWSGSEDSMKYLLVAVDGAAGAPPALPGPRIRAVAPESLGLRETSATLERLGGCLVIAPQGEGAMAYFVVLPVYEENLDDTGTRYGYPVGLEPSPAEMKEVRATILLVDDEERFLKLGSNVLRRLGFAVLESRDGDGALETYRARRDEIDVVLLDMAMPGINGTQVFERLRVMDPKVRVILMSGYPEDAAADRLLQRGAAGFLHKPFSMSEVSLRIRKILRQGKAT